MNSVRITRTFDLIKYGLFLGLNLPLVLVPISVFLLISKSDLLDLIPILTISVVIVFLQYPLLLVFRGWILKTIVFYLSMVTFLGCYGLVVSWNFAAGGYEAGTWNARFSGVLVIVLFGHLFGGIFLPVIVLINWLARKLTFVYENVGEMP